MLEERENMLVVQETKIIDLSNDLVNHTQKLKVALAFSIEKTIWLKKPRNVPIWLKNRQDRVKEKMLL